LPVWGVFPQFAHFLAIMSSNVAMTIKNEASYYPRPQKKASFFFPHAFPVGNGVKRRA
jgi:hypothetical protein